MVFDAKIFPTSPRYKLFIMGCLHRRGYVLVFSCTFQDHFCLTRPSTINQHKKSLRLLPCQQDNRTLTRKIIRSGCRQQVCYVFNFTFFPQRVIYSFLFGKSDKNSCLIRDVDTGRAKNLTLQLLAHQVKWQNGDALTKFRHFPLKDMFRTGFIQTRIFLSSYLLRIWDSNFYFLSKDSRLDEEIDGRRVNYLL